MASAQAMAATARVIPAGFTPKAGQSVEEQVAELGRVVNRLRDWIQEEDQLRDRAIEAARAAARTELQAEAKRFRDLIFEMDGKLQALDNPK
jgi:ribosomal protein L16/L10AE